MLWLSINSHKNNATIAYLLRRNKEKVENELKTTPERSSP
jgi:hypothetical protein